MLVIELMLLVALLVFWYSGFWAGAKYGTLKGAWDSFLKLFKSEQKPD